MSDNETKTPFDFGHFERTFVTNVRLLAILGGASSVLLVVACSLSFWTVNSAKDASTAAVVETKAVAAALTVSTDAKVAALKVQVELVDKAEKEDSRTLRADFTEQNKRTYDKVDDVYKLLLMGGAQQRPTVAPGKGR